MSSEPHNNQKQVLFTRHFADSERAMYGFAYSLVPLRADADDIVQEALVLLWKHFDQYDPERPFLPWANRFVYRQVQTYRRKQATRAKYFFSDETIERLAAEMPAFQERDQAMSRALELCLEGLGGKQRALIEQRYVAKESLCKLADETGRSANSLYKTLQRIRVGLYRCISQRVLDEGFTV